MVTEPAATSGDGEPKKRSDRPSFRLRTLGKPSLLRITLDGESTEVLGPGKPLAVVVYLACAPGRSASREHLIDLLWSNLNLDRARHGLRQTLWYLRKRLGPDAIVTRDQEVVLQATFESDRDRFLEAIDRRDFERAVEVYQGEFLPMFAAPGGADFEVWGDMERFRLRTHFLDAASTVAWSRLERGEPEGAKEVALRARDLHPLAQRTWRLVLEVLLAANDSVAARIEAEAFERRLAAEERTPDAATQRVLDAVQDPQQSAGVAAGPVGTGLRPEFIGREHQFARILAAWRSAEGGRGRHIHVRGRAGLGKTRLVNEVASRLHAMGAHVVQVRAPPGRRGLSYALISEIAGELAKLPEAERLSAGSASVLAGLNPSLTERFSTRPVEAQEGDLPRQRERAMTELVATASVKVAVALFVDDTHWADERSRELLQSLCERTSEHRLLLVTTARPVGTEAMPGSDTELISLKPLSAEGVDALLVSLAELPEEEWAEGFVQQLCASAGGSPLLILESLRFGLERGLLALKDGRWRCPDPEELEAELSRGGALRRRVEGLSGTERRLLLCLCVAGAPVALETVARAARLGSGEVLRELQDMEVRGLVVHDGLIWAPAHDEIATAVMEAVDPPELRQAHGAVGRCLVEEAQGTSGEVDGDLLQRSVRHLLAADQRSKLGQVYDRWVRTQRRKGDRRSLSDLGNEVIGAKSDSAAIRRLTKSLPLSTRLGLSTPGPRRKLFLAGAIAVLVWATAQMVPSPTPSPDAALLVLRPGGDGTVSGYEVPIRGEGWEDLDALDVSEAGRMVPELTDLPVYGGHIVPSPTRDRWAYAGVTDEGWAPDLFIAGTDGRPERVSQVPGDDVPLSWSPDGRQLVFQTGRWNPNHWQDLAILKLETGEIRPLVRSDDSHSAARWSPDGTRVAFRRNRIVTDFAETDALQDPRRPVCWIELDGGPERCLDLPLMEAAPVGWLDPERLLVQGVDTAGARGLFELRLEDGEMLMLHRGVRHARLSPDGRWLAFLRGDSTGDPPGWWVYPIGRPDLARPLVGVDGLPSWSVGWSAVRNPQSHLEHLDLLGPDTVMVGIPVRFRAQGTDPRGRPVPLHMLSWQAEDTMLAAFDDNTELLIPQAPGVTEIRVSAGGWREASGRVTVVPPDHRILWTEEWEEGLDAQWVPFGNPRPSLADWPEGGRAFWNRGDGFYGSGAYSREEFRWSRGLGLEAEISIVRTAPRAQRMSVGFDAWSDLEAVEAWDHRSGGLMGNNVRCRFSYPAGDGTHHRAWAVDRQVELDPTAASGEPYTIRVQIFPDGTCGVAVDGQPLVRAELGTMEDAPDRIVLSGESLDTRVLVGPVKVWEGIRDGVAWSALEWDPETRSWDRR